MLKAIDRGMVIEDIALVSEHGGTSGEYVRARVISVSQARAIILENARPFAGEQTTLADALGRTLRRQSSRHARQPPFDASAMDGYAVRSADTPGTLASSARTGAGASTRSCA